MKLSQILILVIFLSISCTKQEDKKSVVKLTAGASQGQKVDNFDDFKKDDDESCEDEEELKKKLIPEKPKAFNLQGGDAGCEIDTD